MGKKLNHAKDWSIVLLKVAVYGRSFGRPQPECGRLGRERNSFVAIEVEAPGAQAVLGPVGVFLDHLGVAEAVETSANQIDCFNVYL